MEQSMRTREHGLGRWIALATFAVLLVLPGTAAASTQVCNGGFCVSDGLTLTSEPPGLIAAAPVTVDLSVENTSSPLDKDHWLQSASLTISEVAAASPPTLTPSVDLPNGLLLAGGEPCIKPYSTGCAGGHGTLNATITPFIGPAINTTGAFGIEKIVNVSPPTAGAYAEYMVLIKYCVNYSGECKEGQLNEKITIPKEQESQGTEFSVRTGGTVHESLYTVEYAINSFTFHLNGQSSQLESGPAPQTYTILSLPKSCGLYTGNATFASRAAGSVSIPESVSITGCPTAALGPYALAGSTVELDGSGSSPGARPIAWWHWDFGDGTTDATASLTTSHRYPFDSEHTVTLYVEDAAGARSAPVSQTVTVPGRTLDVRLGGSGAGTVTGNGISCPGTCSHGYEIGAPVTLTATPASGSTFAGWGGDCSGTGSCQLTMSTDRSVSAAFESNQKGPPPSPPNTKIGKATINSKKGGARFVFTGSGESTGFECALVSKKHRQPRFKSCRSPKTYRKLKPGRYVFEVRAFGPAGPDPSPAKRKFRIA